MAGTSFPTRLSGNQGTIASPLAGVGTTLSGATAITSGIVVGIAAAGAVAYTLPAAAPAGTRVDFLNLAATAVAATVFPSTAAGKINAGAAGAAFSVAQSKSTTFVCVDGADNWIAVLSA